MSSLNRKDISIIDALPHYDHDKTILNVGCGNARIDRYLSSIGYKVLATDIEKHNEWSDEELLTFYEGVNIVDISTFPIKKSPIVICSEVLEHLENYKEAFDNLMRLTKTRLIITVPFKKSFNVTQPPSPHCNFWADATNSEYKNIDEFKEMAGNYSVAISKITTKDRDYQTGSRAYLVVVDKRWAKGKNEMH